MALFTVIRTFVLAIIFNMILPSGDVYSDIAMMYQTWTFGNTESMELLGCKACYGKKAKDLVPSKKDCTLCIQKNWHFQCGGRLLTINKLLEGENSNECEDIKSSFVHNGMDVLENSKSRECDERSRCCVETKYEFSITNNSIEDKVISKHLDYKLLVDCKTSLFSDLGKPGIYDVCLLVGSSNYFGCTSGSDGIWDELEQNKNNIKNLLREKNDVFVSKNFTGAAYKLLAKKNDSISGSSEYIPVKVNSLNEEDIFRCGILIKPKNVNIIGDSADVDCGLDICKLHLDFLHWRLDGIYDLKSWQTKAMFLSGIRVGGKICHLVRVYALSLSIPITINFLFSVMIFFSDVKSGVSRKYEMAFVFLLCYPQWRTFKILITYFKHKEEEELTNQLKENNKNVASIEPFCESGLQVLIALCIIFSTEAFYPKDDGGESTSRVTVSLASFFISLFASSFGITKFFVTGPLPLLPQNAPLGGVLSMKFIILFLLNTMFFVRTLCLEAALFTSYRSDNPLGRIDALIPEEYRLVVYFFPGVCAFIVNLLRLVLSSRGQDQKYLCKYPQFLLCPMFCPIMWEGNQDRSDSNKQPVRVWKLGSAFNAFFLGCFPQIILLASDYFRRVSIWYDITFEGARNDTNALLTYQYGNTILSITTLVSYSCLIIIFFFWDKIHKDNGCLCNPCKIVGYIFSKPCFSCMSDESGITCANYKENAQQEREASNKNTATVESIETIDEEICIQNDVGTLNHSDAHEPKNKEDIKITGTKWLKNKLRKNQLKAIVASAVFLITCICLIIGMRYGSNGYCKDELPTDYQCPNGCPTLAQLGYCQNHWDHEKIWYLNKCSISIGNVKDFCKKSCNNCGVLRCNPSSYYWTGYNESCCSSTYQCEHQQGGCISDDHCSGNLKCRINRDMKCGAGFLPSQKCCRISECTTNSHCDAGKFCNAKKGTCESTCSKEFHEQDTYRVMFYNAVRNCSVDIIWTDKDGTKELSKTPLAPDGFIHIDTYFTHEFIFKRSSSNDLLYAVANGKKSKRFEGCRFEATLHGNIAVKITSGSTYGLAKSISSKSCKESGNRTITTSQECKDASSRLNLTYYGTKNVLTAPQGCIINDYHELAVVFNTKMVSNINAVSENYHPICKAGFSTSKIIGITILVAVVFIVMIVVVICACKKKKNNSKRASSINKETKVKVPSRQPIPLAIACRRGLRHSQGILSQFPEQFQLQIYGEHLYSDQFHFEQGRRYIH